MSPTYGPDTLDRAPSSRPPGLCLRRAHPDFAPYPHGAPTSVTVSSAGSTRYYHLGGVGVGAAQLSAFVVLRTDGRAAPALRIAQYLLPARRVMAEVLVAPGPSGAAKRMNTPVRLCSINEIHEGACTHSSTSTSFALKYYSACLLGARHFGLGFSLRSTPPASARPVPVRRRL